MPRKKKSAWWQKAARLMILHNLSLYQASVELDMKLLQEEALNIERNDQFLSILWAERQRFFAEIAADPSRTKAAVIGRQEFLIQRLIEQGEYKKAADANLELAKMEGLIGAEAGAVNIFNLSQKDLDKLKAKISGSTVDEGISPSGTKALPN